MNTGVFGKPGRGKTEGQIDRIRKNVGRKAIVLIDPQASLCIRVMMYLTHWAKTSCTSGFGMFTARWDSSVLSGQRIRTN